MKTAAAETPEAGRPRGPLRIAVIGANGKSGSLIAREAAGCCDGRRALPGDWAQALAVGSRFAVGAWRRARGGGVRYDDAMRNVALPELDRRRPLALRVEDRAEEAGEPFV